jgi:hypothetical protein
MGYGLWVMIVDCYCLSVLLFVRVPGVPRGRRVVDCFEDEGDAGDAGDEEMPKLFYIGSETKLLNQTHPGCGNEK